MAQGQRLSDWQIETIRLAYAETGNAAYAAREAGCGATAAKRYIADARATDDLDELRRQKREDVVAQVAVTRMVILEAMVDPARLQKASMSELSTAFGILTDKHQLLTGKATARTEQSAALAPWTDDEVSSLARLAERVKSGTVPS